jgi:hypothetical protein
MKMSSSKQGLFIKYLKDNKYAYKMDVWYDYYKWNKR